jgi:hypothetical protein
MLTPCINKIFDRITLIVGMFTLQSKPALTFIFQISGYFNVYHYLIIIFAGS